MSGAIDRAAALARLGGDAELLEELLQLMLEQSRELVRTMGEALARGDAAAVRLAAHTIRGSAANLDAEPLRAAAERLEERARAGELGDGAALCAAVAAELERLASEIGA